MYVCGGHNTITRLSPLPLPPPSFLQREAQEQEEKERERERERAEKASRLFGGAKPVDTASREKEIEEKLQREKEEFEKKLAEQARHDRDDRGSSQERQREGSRDRARERCVQPECTCTIIV